MIKNPRILIDLEKLTTNTRVIVKMCEASGIRVIGVTKGVCGDPRIAGAIVKGGVNALADARIENIKRLRQGGIKAPLMMLRSPMMSEVEEVVKYCDISLNSEPEVLARISRYSQRMGVIHQVILMTDVGEIREGIMPVNIYKVGNYVRTLEGIKILGVGTNLACYSGVKPSEENMNLLLTIGRELEKVLGYKLTVISGGNSSSLELLASGSLPEGVNQFRIGESILLGHYILNEKPIPGTFQDAFIVRGEIIELKEKPSVPMGDVGKNTFGEYVDDLDLRLHFRGIAAFGRQDIAPESIYPICAGSQKNIKVIGATSDHTVIDFGEANPKCSVGSEINFGLKYPGLLTAMTSPYIKKQYVN